MSGLQWNSDFNHHHHHSSQQSPVQQLSLVDEHATLRYDDVASAGPPARPVDFPAPTVHRAIFVDIAARDHCSGSIHHLKKVLLRSNSGPLNHINNNGAVCGHGQPDTAYLPTKVLAKSVYGSVKLCIVLKRINNKTKTSVKARRTHSTLPENQQNDKTDDYDDNSTANSTTSIVQWESTDYLVAVKFSDWKKIHQLRGKHLEDPIKECASLQLLGNYHPNVIGALEVLQDDHSLYTVMPYVGGADLYGRLLEYVGYRSTGDMGGKGKSGFDESVARTWFRQLLLVSQWEISLFCCLVAKFHRNMCSHEVFMPQAVDHLQKKGVCHRDISLENILLDKDDKLCLVDFGLALRVPYTDDYGGGVTDVSAGTSRRLMISQGLGGKLMYAAPEIISQQNEVDPFATDLWSVGVVLFVMLVGLAPYKWAHPSDKRYSSTSKGGLKNLLEALEIPISAEACDLLQGFMWADPRKRWTLADVMQHPWVLGKQFSKRPSTLPSAPKKYSVGSQDLTRNIKTQQTRHHSPSKIFRGNHVNSKQVSPEVHHNMHILSSQT
jgi:serine/threonine protein kinase